MTEIHDTEEARELLRREAKEAVGTDDLEKANRRYDQLLEWMGADDGEDSEQ